MGKVDSLRLKAARAQKCNRPNGIGHAEKDVGIVTLERGETTQQA
jgi:hypothetical protein